MATPPSVLQALLVLIVLLALVPAGHAQEDEETVNPAGQEPAAEDVATENPPARPRRPSPFSGEVTLAGVYDTNVSRDDEEELSGRGGVAGLVGRYQGGSSVADLYVRSAVARHLYDEPERWNRFSGSLYSSVNVPVAAGVTLDPSASVVLGAITTEYRRVNQLTLRSRFVVRGGRRDRVRPYVAYRHRWYQDAQGTTAFSPYAGVDYRHRWGSWHYADLDLRVEQNRAEVSVRRYTRSTAELTYTRPLSRSTRVRPAVTLRRWWYERTAAPDFEDRRRDWRLTPGVELIHDLTDDLRFESGYRYDVRESNDERRDFDGHRFSASLRYMW